VKPEVSAKGLAKGWPFLITMIVSVTAAVVNSARGDDNNAYGQNKWYVSAAAGAGGNGSAAAPFNTLVQVQQASGPGDTIIVLPSPLGTPPLDGGIALKAGQRLIGGGPSVVKFGVPLVSGGPPVVSASGLPSLPDDTHTASVSYFDYVRLERQ
jgi:hypothetical protein